MGSFPGQAPPSGGVKSVQRGTTDLSSVSTFAVGVVNVTISPVNLNKSVVILTCTGYMQNGGTGESSAPTVTRKLTSPTNLRLTCNGTPFNQVNVVADWEIIEYY